MTFTNNKNLIQLIIFKSTLLRIYTNKFNGWIVYIFSLPSNALTKKLKNKINIIIYIFGENLLL